MSLVKKNHRGSNHEEPQRDSLVIMVGYGRQPVATKSLGVKYFFVSQNWIQSPRHLAFSEGLPRERLQNERCICAAELHRGPADEEVASGTWGNVLQSLAEK